MKFLLTIISFLLASLTFGQSDTSDVVPAMNIDAVKMFPNPAVNDVYITLKQEGMIIKTLSIFDHSGNRLLERKVKLVLGSPLKFSIADIKPGTYTVILETNLHPIKLQLVKN